MVIAGHKPGTWRAGDACRLVEQDGDGDWWVTFPDASGRWCYEADEIRAERRGDTMSTKTKPAKRPDGLMDLHLRLMDEGSVPLPDLESFADAVVRACAASAPEMRRRVFEAVEALRDS